MKKLKSVLFMASTSMVLAVSNSAFASVEGDIADAVSFGDATAGIATIGGAVAGVLVIMMGIGFILSMLRRR